MFPGGSGSPKTFSPRRNQSNLPVSGYQSNIEDLSPLVRSVEATGYSQGVLAGSGPNWSVQSASSTVRDPRRPEEEFTLSAAALISDTSKSHTLLSSDYPLSGPIGQSSIQESNTIKQEPTSQDPRLDSSLGISSYPMSVVSEVYFAGPMQHNSHHYAWANRPCQPSQEPSEHMSPPFPSSHQSYSPTRYPTCYPGHPSGSMPAYQQQESQLSPSYLASSGNPIRHGLPLSPSLTRPFQPQNAQVSTSLPAQPSMISPPPYMMSQPGYYFPETSAVQPLPTPNSSQPPSMVVHEPIYSSPDSSAAGDGDRPVRVLNPRPRPQCWDHGCNGREFSTFSNLLRHQREKSGVVAKAECPVCGSVFTRTTARNIHVAQGKCKSSGTESSAE